MKLPRTVFLTVAVVSSLATASLSRAEFYIGGQGGLTVPNKLSNVEGIDHDAGLKTSDLKLATSGLYGAKAGYFFGRLPWLGVEGDFYYSTPHLEQQPVTQRILNPITGQSIQVQNVQPGGHLHVFAAALNIVARYPGKRFQPYVGVGPGIAWARMSNLPTASSPSASASDSSLMLNVIVGGRYFVMKHLALFAEYKYNRASFDFGNNVQFKADYSANNFVGGIAVHF
ncbi:MAG TPA: outer membrane beta-barrel protein [Nitrospiraceae bacterium]|nr:outer membrane beta-barrel protein [Nitrospiraceae bacterium]